MRKLIALLGSPLDNLTIEETIERFIDFVAMGRATHKGHQVATVNVDFLVKSLVDPELKYILQEVDMATIDGMPLVWGSRWLGTPVTERVAGSDFVPLLVRRAAQEGLSIFLLGATPEVSSRAAEKLAQENPGLVIAGVISPPFQPVLEMDPEIAVQIRAANPDILLVAFGNPKQEKWIEAYGAQVQVPLMIGVGATLDFIAGEIKRAPKWMRRSGLEWLFRMLQEPRRLFKRYFQDLFYFAIYFARQYWLQHPRKETDPQTPKISIQEQEQHSILSLKGEITTKEGAAMWQQAHTALSQSKHLLIDLQDCTFLDSAAVGTIMGVVKSASDRGARVTLTGASPRVQKIISFHKLDYLTLPRSHSYDQTIPPKSATDLHAFVPTDNSRIHVDAQGQDTWVTKAPPRLDGKSSHHFTAACSHLLAQNPKMVIDLGNTIHVSGAGLIALDQLTKRAEEEQGNLCIIGCTNDINRVIKNHRFESKLHIYPDLYAITHKMGG
jgi:N-acetylglucosaminyldiphosphoundecaprenol N-acetyl-beta-D-mannosaminyltransferase